MKFLLTLFLIIISTNVLAWEVVKKKDQYFLVSSDKKTFAIVSEGGDPSFEKIEPFSPELDRVIYKAGVAGTSELKVIYRALLLRKKDHKGLGDFPVSYQSMDGKSKVTVKWELKEDTVVIEDPETESTKIVPLR